MTDKINDAVRVEVEAQRNILFISLQEKNLALDGVKRLEKEIEVASKKILIAETVLKSLELAISSNKEGE